jgi:hypothetical protein
MAPLSLPLTQPQEREDRHDHNDQTDQIDQPIHVLLLLVPSPTRTQNGQKEKTFLSRVNAVSDALHNGTKHSVTVAAITPVVSVWQTVNEGLLVAPATFVGQTVGRSRLDQGAGLIGPPSARGRALCMAPACCEPGDQRSRHRREHRPSIATENVRALRLVLQAFPVFSAEEHTERHAALHAPRVIHARYIVLVDPAQSLGDTGQVPKQGGSADAQSEQLNQNFRAIDGAKSSQWSWAFATA